MSERGIRRKVVALVGSLATFWGNRFIARLSCCHEVIVPRPGPSKPETLRCLACEASETAVERSLRVRRENQERATTEFTERKSTLIRAGRGRA